MNAVDNVEMTGEDEPPKPAKRHRQGGNNQCEFDIIARVAAVQAENQRLKEKLETLEATNFAEVLAQAATTSDPSVYGKSNQSGSQPRSKYMGKQRESRLTPGTDGSLNPNITCNCCGDTGHIMKNCSRLKARNEYNAVRQQPNLLSQKTNCPRPKGPRPGANLYRQNQVIWQKAVYRSSTSK